MRSPLVYAKRLLARWCDPWCARCGRRAESVRITALVIREVAGIGRDEIVCFHCLDRLVRQAGGRAEWRVAVTYEAWPDWLARPGIGGVASFDGLRLRIPGKVMDPFERWRDIVLRDPCAYCGSARATTIDHIEPQALGGLKSWTNETGACRACNERKGATRLLPYLVARLPRLRPQIRSYSRPVRRFSNSPRFAQVR